MLKVKFKENDKVMTGELKYYYNGMFYLRVGGKEHVVFESSLCETPNEITNNFTVESNVRYNLYHTEDFHLAKAFADGYNTCLDYPESRNVAKVYFEEKQCI